MSDMTNEKEKFAAEKAAKRKKPKEEYPVPYTLELDYPIAWDDEDNELVENGFINKLIVHRRLRCQDYKGIPINNMTFDHQIRFISKVTGQPMAIIHKLDAADMMKMSEIIGSFLGVGPMIGKQEFQF